MNNISEAAAVLGRIKTKKKAIASRKNWKKAIKTIKNKKI